MTRLRRATPQMRGWSRRPWGTGFRYLDAEGAVVAPAAVALASSTEPGDTKASRQRAMRAAVEEVAVARLLAHP